MPDQDPWTKRALAEWARSPDEQRTPYQQDRDRVLYSAAFRRLGGIAQVTSATELHVFHNRLTHSLKVAQIGRRLAESLGKRYAPTQPDLAARLLIDPSLVETAGLAHDLGHPPFGHVTDHVLSDLVGDEFGGYEGNAQTFRIVSKLAIKRPPQNVLKDDQHSRLPGLDLTRASLNAILKYPILIGHPIPPSEFTNRTIAKKCGVYPSDAARLAFARNDDFSPTLSSAAILMDWADDVAYAIHDIEDYVRAGVIQMNGSQISRDLDRLRTRVFTRLRSKNSSYTESAVDRAFEDLLNDDHLPEHYDGGQESEYTLQNWISDNIVRCEKAVVIENDQIVIDPEVQYLLEALKAITWQYVIDSPPLAAAQEGQRRMITALFEGLLDWAGNRHQTAPIALQQGIARLGEEADAMPGNQMEYVSRRGVADFIATLTDTQAFDLLQKITGRSSTAVFGVWLV